ncbi:MAG: LytTR family DNA-binding domain-containing protein [Lachnospiraceae bacterium]|nr:LytTR family DNA-binding domain-containing protein [Lachnospiraceae bacterium]
MVYRIALCEDEEFYRKELEQMLNRYSEENQDCFEIYPFKSGEELLNRYSEVYFNILFLDVEMEELSGIGAAEKIREQDENVVIIFVTAYEDFALEAFRVSAFQYLVKPVNYENLSLILNRVLNQIRINTIHNELTEQFISVETTNGIVQLNTDDIKYIEKIKNRIDYYTTHGIYQSYDTVKSLIKRLNPVDFVQINQGEIVNWKKVKDISDNTILVEDVELQISRKNKKKLKERYDRDVMKMMAKSLMDKIE